MKYDDASWHSGGDFPTDLPEEAGATHAGMFLAWATLNDLASEELLEDLEDEVEELRERTLTPGAFFLRNLDGKLTDEDLSEEGNAFASHYFDLENGQYLQDYQRELSAGLPSVYHVADDWASYDRLAPHVLQRFNEWKASR